MDLKVLDWNIGGAKVLANKKLKKKEKMLKKI